MFKKSHFRIQMNITKITATVLVGVILCSLLGCANDDDEQRVVEVYEDVLLGDAPIESTESAKEANKCFDNDEVLDVNNLPDDIRKMVPVCDAIGLVRVEKRVGYASYTPEFVWECIRMVLTNAPRSDKVANLSGNKIIVSGDMVNDYGFAMFGGMKYLPDIPPSMTIPDEHGRSKISFANNLNYLFSKSDRGSTSYKVTSAVMHSDATVDMVVDLIDDSNKETIASFLYTLRPNTKDTSAVADFSYEVIGSIAADDFTKNRMNGQLFIKEISRKYATKPHPVVEEIIEFDCFGEPERGLESLNNRIEEEVVKRGKHDKKPWHNIKSYPSITAHYSQILVLYTSCPYDGTMGDVTTYNYDDKNNIALDIDNAYLMAGTDNEALINQIMEQYASANEGMSLTAVEPSGFFVREDDSVDFYAKIYYTDERNRSCDTIAIYNATTKELNVLEDGDDLLPQNLEYELNPPLTHE